MAYAVLVDQMMGDRLEQEFVVFQDKKKALEYVKLFSGGSYPTRVRIIEGSVILNTHSS